jgi:hypothetical protein
MSRKLYKSLKEFIVADNEAEEAAAIKAGYMDVSVILNKLKGIAEPVKDVPELIITTGEAGTTLEVEGNAVIKGNLEVEGEIKVEEPPSVKEVPVEKVEIKEPEPEPEKPAPKPQKKTRKRRKKKAK